MINKSLLQCYFSTFNQINSYIFQVTDAASSFDIFRACLSVSNGNSHHFEFIIYSLIQFYLVYICSCAVNIIQVIFILENAIK